MNTYPLQTVQQLARELKLAALITNAKENPR